MVDDHSQIEPRPSSVDHVRTELKVGPTRCRQRSALLGQHLRTHANTTPTWPGRRNRPSMSQLPASSATTRPHDCVYALATWSPDAPAVDVLALVVSQA